MEFEIRSLTPKSAYSLINIFQEFYNNSLFIILNKNNSDNQIWKLFKLREHYILSCFQDTYQRYNDNIMGWCTLWIESPNLPNRVREFAAIELTESLKDNFDMIWMNSNWVGELSSLNPIWKIDGQFHWYAYQWASYNNNTSYGIVI